MLRELLHSLLYLVERFDLGIHDSCQSQELVDVVIAPVLSPRHVLHYPLEAANLSGQLRDGVDTCRICRLCLRPPLKQLLGRGNILPEFGKACRGLLCSFTVLPLRDLQLCCQLVQPHPRCGVRFGGLLEASARRRALLLDHGDPPAQRLQLCCHGLLLQRLEDPVQRGSVLARAPLNVAHASHAEVGLLPLRHDARGDAVKLRRSALVQLPELADTLLLTDKALHRHLGSLHSLAQGFACTPHILPLLLLELLVHSKLAFKQGLELMYESTLAMSQLLRRLTELTLLLAQLAVYFTLQCTRQLKDLTELALLFPHTCIKLCVARVRELHLPCFKLLEPLE
mmetsp:Transcript_100279/g.323589  ORF Transcript_100279/g.323589 Transcript_100279/m.323589 type:complete len:341 (-) Transcript_100279:217-1239(-)